MEQIVEEYYVDRDIRNFESVLYYWKNKGAGEERPKPVEINRYPMHTEFGNMFDSIEAHHQNLLEEAEKKRLKEEREGLTRYVAYLNPMQVAVLNAMEAKFEEEEE